MKCKVIILLAIPALFLCACNPATNTQTPALTQNNTNIIIPTTTAPSNGLLSQTTNNPVKTTLTDSELDYFTNYFNEYDNNGFLQSYYSDIRDIDLSQVLYYGAGYTDTYNLSEDEYILYENSTGYEIFCDITKLTTEQINSLLIKKTGVSFNEINNGLDWLFLEEYDAYYFEHGDTNYAPVECLSGYKEDDLYVIQYDHTYYGSSTVTMQKKNGNYLFVSNVQNN